jgi:hypothetical protein
MKTIDIKSLLIGTLLTATIFLGIAATGQTDKWDVHQQWEVKFAKRDDLAKAWRGWEPFQIHISTLKQDEVYVWIRKRVK